MRRRPRSTPTGSPARPGSAAARRRTRCACSQSSSRKSGGAWRPGAWACRSSTIRASAASSERIVSQRTAGQLDRCASSSASLARPRIRPIITVGLRADDLHRAERAEAELDAAPGGQLRAGALLAMPRIRAESAVTRSPGLRGAWIAPLAAAIALIAGGPAVAQEPSVPSVSVIGSAAVSSRPDTADVVAGVVTQAQTAAQALAENTAAMQKVMKTLADLGIAERDVQTVGLSVSPQRAQQRPGSPQPQGVITGYEVTNQVRVRVRNLDVLGRLLDALVTQGANTLGGITFSIADPKPLLQQARGQAITDALQKAQAYAAAAGVKLGRVIAIRDASSGPPRPS